MSLPDSAVPAPKKSVVPMVLGIGCLMLLCGGVLCDGVVGSTPVLNYLTMRLKAHHLMTMELSGKRHELSINVKGIKTAELAYDAKYDGFIPAGRPPSRGDLGTEAHAWPGGSDWDTLLWFPDGEVRGAYWVEVSDDGDDFIVHGVCDVDGDGVFAEYTATSSLKATQVTPDDVY